MLKTNGWRGESVLFIIITSGTLNIFMKLQWAGCGFYKSCFNDLSFLSLTLSCFPSTNQDSEMSVTELLMPHHHRTMLFSLNSAEH